MEFLESEMVEGDDEEEENAGTRNANDATDDNINDPNADYQPMESVFLVENEN